MSETIYYIFVLDEERRLLGVLSLRNLILAPRHALIRDLMETNAVSVRATDDHEQVVKEMSQYDLLALPVVDEQNRMVGIITHDDVIDVVVEEATEDVHRMGGVGPMAENYLEASFVTIWRKRAFWLACLFGAELFTFTALSYFDEAINRVVVLALFVPLCISTGGNSGSQAATLITRSRPGPGRAVRLAARAAARAAHGPRARPDPRRHRLRPRQPHARGRARQHHQT